MIIVTRPGVTEAQIDHIRERVENIGHLPLEALVSDQQSSNAVRAMVVQKLGDKAPLIKSFEYVPAVPRLMVKT